MKKSFLILSALVVALVFTVLAGSASASQITFVSVTGNWHDPQDNVSGSQQGQPVITNGVPTSSINWGVTSGSQSGYDFSRTIPGAQILPPAPTPFFPLGTFTHRNFPVSDPSLTSVQLDVVLVLNVDGVQTGPLNFTFNFTHVETPNNQSPCPYPTPAGEGCTDRVSFVSSPSPTTFNVGGVAYTLSMSFVNNGIPVSEFITREGQVNVANLVGQFTLPPNSTPTPVLTMTKSGPATMNLGQAADFTLDVRNTGSGDAWNTVIRDVLPDGATGGMCDATPAIQSARVYASDGVTPVAGKGLLNAGSDYSLGYSAAPSCRLDITMLTAAGTISPSQRLIIRYRTQLDSNTQNGVTLTNVAGAVQWFDSNNSNRQTFTRTLTNGTPGIVDHEDAFSVTTAVSGYYFDKIVANQTSGANPATTAAPGDRLRYTLRFRTTGQALNNFRILDELDLLNSQAYFAPGTLTLVSTPAGANVTNTSATGGSKGTGLVDIRNLDIAANTQIQIQFDVTLKSGLANGTIVANQASALRSNNSVAATSDDPNVNGTADPNVLGDEDPTRITISVITPPPPPTTAFRIQKISADRTGDPNVLLAGDTLRYTITVKNISTTDATNVVLRDAVPANSSYVAGSTTLNGTAVADVSGASALVSGMLIRPPGNATPGTMPADASSNPANVATITFDVVVSSSAANGTVISNQGFVSGTGFTNLPSDDPRTPAANDPTRDTVTGPQPPPPPPGTPSFQIQKTSADLTGDPNVLLSGETLRYTITARNMSTIDAASVTLRDVVPANTTYVAGSTTLNGTAVADVAGMSGLVNGMLINAPGGIAGSMPSNALATVTFDVVVNSNLANGTVISNQGFVSGAGFTDLPSDDPRTPAANDPTRDTVTSLQPPPPPPTTPSFLIQKTSADMTGDPNVLLAGETLHYTITVKNIGTTDATNVLLRDAIPANTTYVAGSTKLNGAAVADVSGLSRVVNGMPINPPGGTTPGAMPADASSNPANVATITFDVTVNVNVASGTVISNQGLVSGTGFTDLPSDDPTTPVANDPTRNLVGDSGYFFEKTVANLTSGASPATTAAPGDKLRYTLRFRSINLAINNFRIVDEIDALNGQASFVPGTLAIVGPPTGADFSGTNPNGGTKGTGVLDARNLFVSVNGEVVIQYDVTLKSAFTGNTVVSNQATLRFANGTTFATSDDPNVNGAASPNVSGDEDPTRITVVTTPTPPPTTPVFRIQKTAADVSGDPNSLLPGETLQYTITVKNIGTIDATNVVLRDTIPANTNYAPGSTKLNGISVTDVGGLSPLANGMAINSPGSMPGVMTADASSNPANVATITFDVAVNSSVVSGTIISNQGFVSGTGFSNLPSDDPNTPAPNDPTRNVVGNSSYTFEKTVADLTSGANPATSAAPGDKLRYTLRFRTTNQAISNFRIFDEVDALNAPAAFAPGTLTLVTSPAGSDTSATSGTGGLKGTGVVDIRNLNLPANSEVLVQFDVTLKPVLVNRIVVSNQATVRLADGSTFARSDDPNVNGAADPNVSGDEDPTRVTIVAAPLFQVQKVSTDLSGDASILLAGETLRYTIAVKNVGTTDGTNVVLRDVVPANTVYVAGSTTLNGTAVADVAGASPLVNGMLIHPPSNSTPGSMPADTSTTQPLFCWIVSGIPYCRANPPDAFSEIALVTFDVVVNANTANGTVISNQGFVNGTGFVEQPSDDPRTSVPNDPTRDIVGDTGYFFEKTVADLTSGSSPAKSAAPGDTLRYTLRLRTTNQALNNFSIVDELDALNAQPAFAPGTLTLVASPAGADINATSSTGGAKGTGVIDIRNLNVPSTAEILIQFDVTLKSGIANDTVVSNQSTLRLANGTTFALSDDPNVNGASNPNVTGDEDPTRLTIVSSAAFRVQKISTDLTGDPNVLLAGETLRYTITVKNIATADALNVTLRDAIPANTAYVAGSTKLNGAAVADASGMSPLVSGMRINPPGSTTPGAMPADASGSTANVATISFDVIVNTNVPDGTEISNQGFVSANGIVDQPSDDPRTPAINDPTRDIVGNKPKLYAEKRVVLFGDLGSPNIVDPGDTLRYTITVQNTAAIRATGVLVKDTVPTNTTYVANSTLLNGAPFGQPDSGASPLAAGINIGTIAAGATATLQFDLRVNAGTPPGTAISNQAVVSSVELPNLLTDGDGNPATGPEPTVIVVGAGQLVSISNQVSVVGGGAAVPGAQVEYVVKVLNAASVPALNVVISDDLNAPQSGQITYVNLSATLNGLTSGINFTGSTITYDYGSINGPLMPGTTAELRFRATLATNLTAGTTVTNTAVVNWNTPTQTASANASIVIGAVGGLAVLNGSAWHDANFNEIRDSGERPLSGWSVELYKDSQLSQTVQTDANGDYRMINVEANSGTAVKYELHFLAPGSGVSTAKLGRAASPFTNGLQEITNIVVEAGANLQGLNLPIHPNGVIYNSQSRAPIAGATLRLLDARGSAPLPAACFDDPAQQGQISLADGYYKFDINFSDPACASGADYVIGVTSPAGTNWAPGYSQIIPPTSSAVTAAFSVPACPSSSVDAIPGTTQYCEVQPSEFAPVASIAARSAGTTYHLHLLLNGSQMPGTSQIFNNHIPIDPVIAGGITVSMTASVINVTRGQLVPYLITVNNTGGMMYTDLSVVAELPPGFAYVSGSALLDGKPAEPSDPTLPAKNGAPARRLMITQPATNQASNQARVMSGTLSWNGLTLAGKQSLTVKLLAVVSAGAGEGGTFVSRAQVMSGATGIAVSSDATATVRIIPEPNIDCTDVTGKVFDDANRNGLQDDDEKGLPGVRVVTVRGLAATTDQYGRYHLTCAITPNESRGSNFVLKLDDRTLPSGFRMSTDKMKIQRATRGKNLQINFAASIHRVISIDMLDEAFEPGKTEIREQWRPRLNLLLDELRKSPSVLRLSYVADTEDEALVKRRVEAIERELNQSWGKSNSGYKLTIEPEVFWRRGAPAKRPDLSRPKR